MGRLIVFGGGGFVGGNLCSIALRRGWEVHIADARVRSALPAAGWHAVDITDAAAVRTLVREVQPDAAVDLAAVADIDRAERERELAWAVNVEAAGVIASACAELGAACVYFSSDAVFPGTASLYREEDPLGPVNYYGRTKAEGEQAVSAACPGATLVRISLALGFPVTDGNSFFAALEAKLRAGAEIVAPEDEVRTPVDVLTLSECVLELLELRPAGPIHIGATGSIDRATLTRKAASSMGYGQARILAQPSSAAAAPGRAPRHRNGIISVAKAQSLLRTPLLSVERSIQRAIAERLPRQDTE
jgi:dTDP-4-dehydrorhamnose reductase